MAVVPKKTDSQDPEFVTYLFTLKRYNCHFVVGNNAINTPEKIGVVKDMLMAHSEVLRSDMLDSDIEEGKCIAVTDMYPDTFRNLLRYFYGHDNIGSLSFDEADNLLYAAEKYMVGPLKARLADRLLKLLTPDNICSLLNNPACYRLLELDSAINKILQDETAKVLVNPQFLDLSSAALTKVFKQVMNVPEIEVWRAAVKWAKHQTNSDNGQVLRKALEEPAKHIRVCAIDDKSFYGEVYPACVLTDKEVGLVAYSKHTREKHNDLITFSNEMECRYIKGKPVRPIPSSNKMESRYKKVLLCKLDIGINSPHYTSQNLSVSINVKDYTIELLALTFCMPTSYNHLGVGTENLGQLECAITITCVTASSEPSQTVNVSTKVEYKEFTIPMVREGKTILRPNNKYRLELNFSKPVPGYVWRPEEYYSNQHISIHVLSDETGFSYGRTGSPIKSLLYHPY